MIAYEVRFLVLRSMTIEAQSLAEAEQLALLRTIRESVRLLSIKSVESVMQEQQAKENAGR
jgi:hypothetical protein